MKIDLHCHCSERSGCSVATEDAMLSAAVRYGLDAVAITDHNRYVPAEHLDELRRRYAPLRIFTGIEVNVRDAGEDMLVLGVRLDILERERLPYEELYPLVRENGGFLVLCHPYRFSERVNLDLDRYAPDAIEIHSSNIGRCDEERIRALCARCGCPPLGNSDAHRDIDSGIYYNDLPGMAEDDAGLVRLLRAGGGRIVGDAVRIAAFNEVVRKREDGIRALIRAGKTAASYDGWSGHFDRIAMGRSYEI